MNCWNCKKEVEISHLAKIGFRAVCEHCNCYLHSCLGCKFHQEGRPNECQIPGTDPVRDRSASNFCDEFSPLKSPKKSENRGQNRFDDLFK